MRNIDMMRGAKTLVDVCGAVKKNEKILVVTDTNNVKIAEIIASVAFEKGAEIALCIMTARKSNGENPPEMISQAMMKADVIFAPTTYSITWAEATRKAADKGGARVVSMPDYNEDILISGGLEADFLAQEEIVDKMSCLFTEATNARLTTPAGTDIFMKLGNRKGNSEKGFCRNAGDVCGPPNIESNIAPIEETANGIIVCDASIIHPEIRKLDNPVIFNVKNGFVVNISGEGKAIRFKEILENANNPTVFNIAELGIGFNPKAKIVGFMTEDEGCLGTAHIGLGDNHTRQGIVNSPMHIDLVLKNPTLFLDDELVIENSKMLFV